LCAVDRWSVDPAIERGRDHGDVVDRSRRQRQLAADDAGVERPSLLADTFDVQLQLLGIVCCFVERVALRVQAGQVGGVHVVAALVLRLKDELDLARLGYAGSGYGRRASGLRARFVRAQSGRSPLT